MSWKSSCLLCSLNKCNTKKFSRSGPTSISTLHFSELQVSPSLKALLILLVWIEQGLCANALGHSLACLFRASSVPLMSGVLDELCTGPVSGLNDSCMGLKSEDKHAGDIHKWRKEVNVKKTWCKLSSGLFGWRRQKVTSWRHEETGSLMTSQEYTSYVKGNTQKGDTFKNFPFNSTLRAALPTEDSLDGVQARIESY